jgi:hypothetical protein
LLRSLLLRSLLLLQITIVTLYLIIACNYYIISIVNRLRVLALPLLLIVLNRVPDYLLLNSLAPPDLEPKPEPKLEPEPEPELKPNAISLIISLVDLDKSLSY